MARKLFCEISPLTYQISYHKEILKRHLRNLNDRTKFADEKLAVMLPVVVKSHSSILLRKLHGVDMRLQENKVNNILLASAPINMLVIHPGETFSFWHTVKSVSARKGYKEGLVITSKGEVGSGIGGGLCQLANLIHWLVLNSPLTVTELHHHSDALFPDERRRVPFGTGTSILYNYLDYRFRNDTDQDMQLVIWVDEESLLGELRTTKELPYRYRLIEENNHFRKEGEEYYRISQVYQLVISRETGETIDRKLVLDNHSRVLYDHSLIPQDQIRDE